MDRPTMGARTVAAVTGTVFALGFPATFALSTANAATGDRDGDGIPNRWEKSHGMNPSKAADARADFDRDGLNNLREYRVGSLIRDEDTDNDGHDDGDEVTDGHKSTDVLDADTDNDGIEDGDEDADRDDLDNEDEDDADENCARDDNDRDGDHVTDEDENDFGLKVRSADSDSNGVTDGDEDTDEDGEANEDDDDDLDDACDGDHDGDGEDDEDEEDVLGTIESFDSTTGTLVITAVGGYTITGVVTDDTEIEFEEADGDDDSDDSEDSEDSDDSEEEFEDREATTADLKAGVLVAEIEFDDETGTLEEIEIYQTTP